MLDCSFLVACTDATSVKCKGSVHSPVPCVYTDTAAPGGGERALAAGREPLVRGLNKVDLDRFLAQLMLRQLHARHRAVTAT